MDSEEQTGGQHFMFAKYYELICEALGFFFFMRAEICFHIVAVQKCSKRSFSMYLQKCLVCVCVVLSFCFLYVFRVVFMLVLFIDSFLLFYVFSFLCVIYFMCWMFARLSVFLFVGGWGG